MERVVSAASQAKQRLLPFCGVAAGIAAIGGWTYRLRSWQKSTADEHKRNEKETTPTRRTVNEMYYRSNCHVFCSRADSFELH